jgi:hypothetical protein
MADVIDTGPWPGLLREGSEQLYDYQNLAKTEVGYWTPNVVGATSAGTATYTTVRFGTYYRLGDIVHLSCAAYWTAHTGTGTIIVTGFPFRPISPTSAANVGFFGTGVMMQAGTNQQAIVLMTLDQYWVSSGWAAVSYPRIRVCTTTSAPQPGGSVTAGGTCGVNFSLWYSAELRI